MTHNKLMVPFFGSLSLFVVSAAYISGTGAPSALAQDASVSSESTYCGLYDGGFCGDQSYCRVPGRLTGCLQWGIRPVYWPKTIKQCTVPGTPTGDVETDPTGDCTN
jgi:hypothetical protein